MTEHPSPFELEAFSVGETTPDLESHIADCDACRAYISQLSAERSDFLEHRPASAFLSTDALKDAFAEETQAPSFWQRLIKRRALIPVLVAAAAVIIWARQPSDDVLISEPSQRAQVSKDKILIKGKAITALVERKRGSSTERFSTRVAVKKNDQLNVLVNLSQGMRLSVALQDQASGQWAYLVRQVAFDSGLNQVTVENSQTVTDEQTRGRLIVGAPEDVDAVVAGVKPRGSVETIEITPELAQ